MTSAVVALMASVTALASEVVSIGIVCRGIQPSVELAVLLISLSSIFVHVTSPDDIVVVSDFVEFSTDEAVDGTSD